MKVILFPLPHESFRVGFIKSEVGSRKSELGSRKIEVESNTISATAQILSCGFYKVRSPKPEERNEEKGETEKCEVTRS